MASTINDQDPNGFEEMFSELSNFKDSMAKTNQPLIPILIKLFGMFREQLKEDMTATIAAHTAVVTAKDEEISQLNDKVTKLETENKRMHKIMDDADQYERKDSVILSGPAVPDMTSSEDTHQLVQQLLKDHLDVTIVKQDINTTHRLGPVRGAGDNTNKRNIYIKFVRRDIKKEVIQKSKQKSNKSAPPLRALESLTPLRRRMLGILSTMKKKAPTLVKGCTTMDGKVFAFTPPAAGMTRDERHFIPDMEALENFCRDFIQQRLEDFLNSVSH